MLTALPANYRQLLIAQHAAPFAPNLCVSCGVEEGFPDFCPWCPSDTAVLVDEPTEFPCTCTGCKTFVPADDSRGQCDYCWRHCGGPLEGLLSFSSGNVDPWVTTGVEPF